MLIYAFFMGLLMFAATARAIYVDSKTYAKVTIAPK